MSGPTRPEDISATAAGASDADLRARSPTYDETRLVGRICLPATVLGLIVHAAEHASRHPGLRAAPAP
jgi:hypothetical protein